MKKIILPSIALVIIVTAACKKSDSSTSSTSYASLSAMYQAMAQPATTTTLDATTGGSFYGPGGSRFIFPANAFQTAAGVAVIGNVQIQVNDYLTKADMIYATVLPYSDGNALMSGGETYVKVTQSGQELNMKPGVSYQVNMPQATTPAPGMSFFLGMSSDNSGPTNTVNWKMGDTIRNRIVYNGDTLSMFSDSLHYCNADQFMASPSYQSFTVNISGLTLPTSGTVWAYALYDNFNGVWPMTHVADSTITESHVPNTPVHFVVMTIIGSQFYGGITGATPATGSTYTVTLSTMDPASFRTMVRAL